MERDEEELGEFVKMPTEKYEEDRNFRFGCGFLTAMAIVLFVLSILLFGKAANAQSMEDGTVFNDSVGGNCYEVFNGKPRLIIMSMGELKRIDTIAINFENFVAVCDAYCADDPDILYAMAILETGRFTKPIFTVRQNPLALNSKSGYRTYSHWTECIADYVDKVQYKRREGEEMYGFLKRIGYSGDQNYETKVRMIQKQILSALNEEEFD